MSLANDIIENIETASSLDEVKRNRGISLNTMLMNDQVTVT